MRIVKIGIFLILSAIAGFLLSLLIIFLLSSGQSPDSQTNTFFFLLIFVWPILSLMIFISLTFFYSHPSELSEKKAGFNEKSILSTSIKVIISLIASFLGLFIISDLLGVGNNIISGLMLIPTIFIVVFSISFWILSRLKKRENN